MEQNNHPFFTDIEKGINSSSVYMDNQESSKNTQVQHPIACSVDNIELSPQQIDAIHVGKMYGNRFERIFIDDDLVNEIVYSVLDYDIPEVQTNIIVNLDNDKPIIQYRGYFRRVTFIVSIMMLVFFVFTVVYIMIFHPK